LCTLLPAVHLEELPVFVFSCQPADDDATVYSRMFGPCIGIREDPATGAASGPLGAYLQHNAVSVDNASRLVNLQGVRMGRPGRINISLSTRAGVLQEVRVGGEAVVVGEGTISRLTRCRLVEVRGGLALKLREKFAVCCTLQHPAVFLIVPLPLLEVTASASYTPFHKFTAFREMLLIRSLT
jgi:hypothetical protein